MLVPLRIMRRCAAQVLPTTRRLMTRVVATRTVASRAAPAAMRPSFGALLPSKAHRAYCSSAPSYKAEMEELNTEFAEARYALADAEESVGTTYFSDDLEDARDATEKVGAAAALGSMTLILVISLSAPRRSQVLERYKAMHESLPEGSDARMELHSHPVESALLAVPRWSGSLALASGGLFRLFGCATHSARAAATGRARCPMRGCG